MHESEEEEEKKKKKKRKKKNKEGEKFQNSAQLHRSFLQR